MYDHSYQMPSAADFMRRSIPKSLMPQVKEKGINIDAERNAWLEKHAPGGGRPSSTLAPVHRGRGRSEERGESQQEQERGRAASQARITKALNILEKNDPSIGVCDLALVGKCPEQDKAKCKRGRHVDPEEHEKNMAVWRANMAKHLRASQ